jgi:hypothetical protein
MMKLASWLLLSALPCVSGHAYVFWPAARNLQVAPHLAHCFNKPGPVVNFESAHNTGGKGHPGDFARGMCGYVNEYKPTDNLDEDKIANWAGAAPETYQAGGSITFTIVNNAEHGGHYEFRLCDRKLNASIGSREDVARCFDAHFLGRQCVPQCGCNSDRCKETAEHNDPNDPIFHVGQLGTCCRVLTRSQYPCRQACNARHALSNGFGTPLGGSNFGIASTSASRAVGAVAAVAAVAAPPVFLLLPLNRLPQLRDRQQAQHLQFLAPQCHHPFAVANSCVERQI